MDPDIIAREPAKALASDIDQLRATLDRLTRVCDSPIAEMIGIDVVARTPRSEPAPAHAARHDHESVRATGARQNPTVAEHLVSWTIGTFRRCHYCRAFGTNLERSARGRLAWRCRRCGYRSTAAALPIVRDGRAVMEKLRG